MHYRRLGRWGLKLSEISLGAWVTFGEQLTELEAVNLIHAAYEMGVNFFDNADINANGKAEETMGKAIRTLPREAVVLSSKVFWPTFSGPNGRGLSRKHIIESCNASLRRLNTDYIDLYFCHRHDPDTPYEEIVYAMDTLLQQGKILYYGTSEWRAAQISSLHGVARRYNVPPPVVEQPQYNMFHRQRVEDELSPVAEELGVGLTVWGPLSSGILSGKYSDGIPEGSRAALESMSWVRDQLTPARQITVWELSTLAHQLGLTTAQLAIAWLLRRRSVTSVITGATSIPQLEENVEAGDAVRLLTEDVLERIEEILGNLPDVE